MFCFSTSGDCHPNDVEAKQRFVDGTECTKETATAGSAAISKIRRILSARLPHTKIDNDAGFATQVTSLENAARNREISKNYASCGVVDLFANSCLVNLLDADQEANMQMATEKLVTDALVKGIPL